LTTKYPETEEVKEEAVGLYELIGGVKNGELTSQDIAFRIKSEMEPDVRGRLSAWKEELEFWEEYAKIYFNLEKAWPYSRLTSTFKKFLEPKEGEHWLDVGCGPLRISELLYEKSNREIREIEAIDIVLEPAREKLANLAKRGVYLPVNLRYASITDPLPYPNDFFDGIGANLILSYVTDFQGKKGKGALEGILREMFRVLKPGGHMVWSTPKHGVNFKWVFIASIPDMLNVYEYIVHKDFTRILQGTRILKHAMTIQEKGTMGIYTFLPKDELENLLFQIGFVNPVWEKTFTQQVWVNRVEKPPLSNP